MSIELTDFVYFDHVVLLYLREGIVEVGVGLNESYDFSKVFIFHLYYYSN